MTPKFPVTIPESYTSALFTLLGNALGCFFIAIFAMLFTGGRVQIMYIVVSIYALYSLYMLYIKTGKKIILTESVVSYFTRQKTFTFAYSDIEKVGYSTLYRSGYKGAGSFYQVLHVYVDESTNPIVIDMNAFSKENVLLFLKILHDEAPKVQFGDRLNVGVTTGNFPKSMPYWHNGDYDTYLGSMEKAASFRKAQDKSNRNIHIAYIVIMVALFVFSFISPMRMGILGFIIFFLATYPVNFIFSHLVRH